MNQFRTSLRPVTDGPAYHPTVPGRSRGRRWARLCAAAAALTAVCGASGISQSVALAGPPPVLNWTNQSPATSPSARWGAAMAYDAATGTVVLFGGGARHGLASGTWAWDGSTWTKQHPATSPPGLYAPAMAYDAATGTVVLFGGSRAHPLGATWTWDGSTWTRQHPAASPTARSGAAMAYDAATGTVVLFGGIRNGTGLRDTWTWDGSTWTRQHPATRAGARFDAAMAYDAATGTVVLFGGRPSGTGPISLGDTWAWNGSTWAMQHPATSPGTRWGGSMAYDATTGNVVLFGGYNADTNPLADTWTWDGSTWTRQSPATSPPGRYYASMAYDATTGSVVLFGGSNGIGLADTWIWSPA